MPGSSFHLHQGLERAGKRLKSLRATRPLQLSILTGSVLIVWGTWVWLPFTAFIGPNFRAFLDLMPEAWWGRAAFCIGLVQLAAALFDNGKTWRTFANGLSFFTFGTIAGTFALSAPGSTGVLIYSVFATIALLAYITRLLRGDHD